jgi:Clostripain family
MSKPKQPADAGKAVKHTTKTFSSTPKEWTIMIYMAGDNNLSEEMIRAIIELKERIKKVGYHLDTTSSPYVRNGIGVLVEFDGEHPVVPSRRYNLTYYDQRTYNNTSKPIPVPDAEEPLAFAAYPDLGIVELRVLKFIEYCQTTQPANNYALILSGHADAFMGKTLLLDENPPGTATVQGLAEVIREKFPQKLDIIAFDGCVMNSLEVLYEFKDYVKTWVGSQGSIPNFTWDYAEIAELLMDYNAAALNDAKVVDAFQAAVEKYNCGFAFGGRSVDLSAIDLSKVNSFSGSLHYSALIVYLLLYLFNQNTLVGSKLLQVLLQAHWNCQTFMQSQSVDLFDFLNRVRIECIKVIRQTLAIAPTKPPNTDTVNVSTFSKKEMLQIIGKLNPASPGTVEVLTLIYFGATRLIRLLKPVVKKGIFVGADYRYSNGISIFMPWSYLAQKMSQPEYMELNMIKTLPGWLFFLKAYTAVTARPEQYLNINLLTVDETITKLRTEFNLQFMGLKKPGKGRTAKITWNIFDVFSVDLVEKIVTDKLGDTKDNPNRTRGLETYLYYFSKTNNIFPELNIKGRFPPRIEEEPCEEQK